MNKIKEMLQRVESWLMNAEYVSERSMIRCYETESYKDEFPPEFMAPQYR